MADDLNERPADTGKDAGERGVELAPGVPGTAPGDDAAGSGAAPRGDSACGGASNAGPAAQAAAANGQPIYVNVQAPKRSNAPIIVLCVLVGVLVLSLGSCAFAGSALVGGLGTFMTSAATNVVSDDSLGIAWEPSVAVIEFDGEISSGGAVTPQDMRDAFAQAESDPNIKSILLVCNSPGGEAAPSWDISQTVAACSKPVVVAVDSTCASGAYMVASQADWIVANPMSNVGAIGVYSQAIDASGLLDKIGVEVETIKSTEMKDMGSVSRSLTDEERAYLQEQVDDINEIFIDLVAQGRDIEVSEVEQWANGTTYLGQQALDMGMVDELGTYGDALAKAAELGGLSEDCPTVSIGASSDDLIDMLLAL